MKKPDSGYIETSCYFTWKGADGIVRSVVKPKAEVKLEDAKENSKAVNSFEHTEKFPIIVDTAAVKSITKEAREYFSLRNRESKVNAIAMIQGNALSNIIVNFYIGLNKPTVPVKLFTNETQAKAWCLKFLNPKDV